MTAGGQRVAAVTGAAGNLGRAVVERLRADGLQVVRIERTQARLGSEVLAQLDFASPDSVIAAFAAIAARLGRLDAVVHTVGEWRGGKPVLDTPIEEYERLFATNALTSATLLRAALSVMLPKGTGRIALVVSSAASAGRARNGAYSASKAAQLRVIESAAQEVAGSGIGINAVLPGTMDTPQNRAAMPKADFSRWLSLASVADVLAFLVSPASNAIHGQAIPLRPEV